MQGKSRSLNTLILLENKMYLLNKTSKLLNFFIPFLIILHYYMIKVIFTNINFVYCKMHLVLFSVYDL